MATVPYVTYSSRHRKFQAASFLLNRGYKQVEWWTLVRKNVSDERGEGQALFLNRTFSEHCTARWIIEYIELIRSVLEHMPTYSKYSLVRVMFGKRLATNCPLHCAVLDRTWGESKLLLEEVCDIKAVDKGGRTITHLFGAQGHRVPKCEKVTNSRWGHEESLYTKNNLLKWTPLRYAEQARNW